MIGYILGLYRGNGEKTWNLLSSIGIIYNAKENGTTTLD